LRRVCGCSFDAPGGRANPPGNVSRAEQQSPECRLDGKPPMEGGGCYRGKLPFSADGHAGFARKLRNRLRQGVRLDVDPRAWLLRLNLARRGYKRGRYETATAP
jgi:hypothetical protein